PRLAPEPLRAVERLDLVPHELLGAPGPVVLEGADHERYADCFMAVMESRADNYPQKLGGWGDAVQGPVEAEASADAAGFSLKTPDDAARERIAAAAFDWRVVFQFL
ncbi:MAG: hypothetical protein AAFR52_20745, partial [Pseudomonadota bacterium]